MLVHVGAGDQGGQRPEAGVPVVIRAVSILNHQDISPAARWTNVIQEWWDRGGREGGLRETHFNGVLYYTKPLKLRDTVSPTMLWACYSKNNLLKTKT